MADGILSGIYAIRNTVNGKRYVGSSATPAKRWKTHKLDLSKNKHHSPALQRAWHKYGSDAFVFEIIEHVSDRTQLHVREQFWIDYHHAATIKGYNILPSAGSNLGHRLSEASKEKMREYRNRPEIRAANSSRQRGKSPTPEALASLRAASQDPVR